MSRALLRRLDDAFCAFRTGHTRRDLDRANRRRLQLLCERAIASETREMDDDRTGLVGIVLAPRLDAFRDDLKGFLQGRDRGAHRRLAERLDLRRASLQRSRLDELAYRKAGGSLVDAALYSVELLSIPPANTYGKLYEGLLEKRPRDHFLRKQFFRRLNGHRLLRSLKLRWCARGSLPVSMLHGREDR